MPQEKADIEAANRKKGGKLAEGKVLPKEDTDIFSTGASKHMGEIGTKHIVHRIQAGKLLAKGFATLEEPEISDDQIKLTDSEIEALAIELGKQPTKAQLEKALKAKIAAQSDEL